MAENSELKVFLQEHGTKILATVVVVIAIVVGVTRYADSRKVANAEGAALLGKGMTLVYAEKYDEALAEFEAQMPSLSGLHLAKAALLSGNIKYRAGDFDGAGKLFETAAGNAGSATLILAGALHGSASVSIEKKDYAKAASQLEAFIDKFGRRDGDLEARYSKEEPADLVPTVSDALWKLTLCYQELGKVAEAKATAERLKKVYGDKPEVASKVDKFLASI